MSLLIKNVRQIVLVCDQLQSHLTCQDIPTAFKVIENASISIDNCGIIERVGDVVRDEKEFDSVIDASGLCVIPGLVDGHTHPVWAGDRVHEFAMKLKGASYMDIHKAGGGIGFTVRKTREATEEELLDSFVGRLRLMARHGTTTVECKSGYGLNTDTELKMLRVLERAKSLQSLDISVTYCGAHSIPSGLSEREATDDVLEKQIPAIVEAGERGEVTVDNIDVFCEKGIFETACTREILEKGKEQGWKMNFHAEELNYIGGVEMGVEAGATAISHLEEISEEGIRMMAEKKTAAVILPTTAWLLKLKPPPVRKMLDSGVVVALGTDYNPNAHCLSMLRIMNMACVEYRMTMEEAMAAATLNSAASVGLSDRTGSVEVGKWADLVLLRVPSWEHCIYQMDASDTITHVIKKGKVIHQG